jgi:hypothetical protein
VPPRDQPARRAASGLGTCPARGFTGSTSATAVRWPRRTASYLPVRAKLGSRHRLGPAVVHHHVSPLVLIHGGLRIGQVREPKQEARRSLLVSRVLFDVLENVCVGFLLPGR